MDPSSKTPGRDSFDANALLRIESTCKDLNVRIARLAVALGLSLDSAADVERVLHHQPAPLHGSAGGRPADAAERRREHWWIELRGLLLMRNEIEKRFVEEAGPAMAKDLMTGIEQQMERQGFKPGADGVDLGRLPGRG